MIAAEHALHLDTVEFAGHRYVVATDLGLGQPVPLMVHGNARVYLSLVHAVAEELLGGPLPRVEEYGYERLAFEIEGTAFETPAAFQDLAEYGNVTEAALQTAGMLGFDWMRAHGAMLDDANRSLYLQTGSVAPASAG